MQAARIHCRSKESAELALRNRGEGEDAVNAFLLLAELYGTVHIYHWRDETDAWGAHWSLDVQCTNETREWNISITKVPHW